MARPKEHRKFYIISGTCGEGPNAYIVSLGYTFSEYVVQKFFDSIHNPNEYIYEEFNEEDLVTTLDLYELDKDLTQLSICVSQYDQSNYIVIPGSLYEDVLEVDFISGYIRESVMTILNLIKLMEVFKDKEQIKPIVDKLMDNISLLHLLNRADISTISQLTDMPKDIQDKIELDGCDALIDPVGLFKSYYKQY